MESFGTAEDPTNGETDPDSPTMYYSNPIDTNEVPDSPYKGELTCMTPIHGEQGYDNNLD